MGLFDYFKKKPKHVESDTGAKESEFTDFQNREQAPLEESRSQSVSASKSAGALEHTFLIGDRFAFWFESVGQIETLLKQVKIAVSIASESGFDVKSVWVGGGVHERDTGYESFSSHTYYSLSELEEKLIPDFEKEENELDGMWFTTLNFESMVVAMECEAKSMKLVFYRGKMKVQLQSQTKETDVILSKFGQRWEKVN